MNLTDVDDRIISEAGKAGTDSTRSSRPTSGRSTKTANGCASGRRTRSRGPQLCAGHGRAWSRDCSRRASPTRETTARSTSRSNASRRTAGCRSSTSANSGPVPAAALRATSMPRKMRVTSPCGRRPSRRTSSRRGVGRAVRPAAAPGGTSSARRWRSTWSAGGSVPTNSTSTRGGSTSSFRIMRTRSRRVARTPANPSSPATGCTGNSSTSVARRCRSVSGITPRRATSRPTGSMQGRSAPGFQTHYRQKLDLTDDALDGAREGARRLGEFGDRLARAAAGAGSTAGSEAAAMLRSSIAEAMNDDLNSPRAVAALFDFVREANRLFWTGRRLPGRSSGRHGSGPA